MSAVLTVQDLYKSYRSGKIIVQALKGISFSIEEGEIFAFLGPNGSGKTTTMNILARLIAPESGIVTVLGRSFSDPDYYHDLSFMNGDAQFLWMLRGIDILRFYAKLLNVSEARVQELLEEFGLHDRQKRFWHQYSNGEKTRLRLVRALLRRPKILFLDEPTVGLDPDAADQLRKTLLRLRREGMTIMITSHYMQDIEELADRVCFIHTGRIQASGTLADFRRPRGYIEVEWGGALPEKLPGELIKDGSRLRISYASLAPLLGVSDIRHIEAGEESLHDYFIALAREERSQEPDAK